MRLADGLQPRAGAVSAAYAGQYAHVVPPRLYMPNGQSEHVFEELLTNEP